MNRARFVGLFLDEARSHLNRASEELTAFEAAPQQPAVLGALMRHCHSLKGMAATMGFEPFVELSHRMEGLLSELEQRPRLWSNELAPLFALALEQLNAWIEAVEQGQDPGRTESSETLVARIDAQLSEELIATCSTEDAPETDTGQWSVRLLLQVSTATPTHRIVSTLRRVSALGRVLHVRPPQLPVDDSPSPMELRFDLASPRAGKALERRLQRLAWVSSVELTPLIPHESRATAAHKPTTWTRVPADALDWISGGLRELALEESIRLEGKSSSSPSNNGRSSFLLKRLFGRVEELRLVPFVSLSHRLEPAARDAARREHKKVGFSVRGGELGLDPALLDRLIGPLRHLVRNAVAHGVELPEDRMVAGKSATGHVEIRLERRADRIVVTVEDDGHGMDAEAIRDAAIAQGAIGAAEADGMSEAEMLQLALHPGVSTRAEPDGVAGRGAGLDSVAVDLREIGASFEMQTESGLGTRMILELPLAQSLVQSLVFRRDGQTYGVPLHSIRRASSAGTPPRDCKIVDLGDERHPLADDAYLLLLDDARHPIALAADEVLGRRELWLQPLASVLSTRSYVHGAALIEDGSMAIVIDPKKLLHGW